MSPYSDIGAGWDRVSIGGVVIPLSAVKSAAPPNATVRIELHARTEADRRALGDLFRVLHGVAIPDEPA